MRKPVGVANFVAVSALTAVLALTLDNALNGQPGSSDAVDASMASDSSSLVLELNLPAFRLDVMEDASVIRSFKVAVGTRQYRTPVGEFAISRVVWNPWWYPPDAAWAAKDSVTPPGPRHPMGKVKPQLAGVLEHVLAAVDAAGYDRSTVVDSTAQDLVARARSKTVSVSVKTILRDAPLVPPVRSP